MRRIGKRYRPGRPDDHYDVIVIGSGIGGLANAALLSKLGKKVCVLEQHYTAGGFTHSYEREGYEWDVGVHYVGDVHKPYSTLRRIFDVISDGQLKWAEMDEVYDRIVIEDRVYDFKKGRDNFRAMLVENFPEEEAAIDDYMAVVLRCAKSAQTFFKGKVLPIPLAKAYQKVRPMLVPKENLMTVREVLESLTSNQELIALLCGQWGDYGMVPDKASFIMHANVVKHYWDGGSYPVGGSWKIADTIRPVIQAQGGEVFTYARVKNVLIENGKACGVVMEDGEILRADAVVSNAGARNTFEKLLPEAEQIKYNYPKKMEKVRASYAHLCLYVGLKGTAEELQIPKTNYWVYPGPHHEQNVAAYEQDANAEFPMVYISFPSAKDPEWEKNYPGKSTVEALTFGPYEWFEQWADKTWNKRGEDYEQLKQGFTDRLLEAMYRQMPQLRGKVDYCELSTPLSTEWFQLNDRGEIYGLDHAADRFKQDWLHSITPVKGLYMTGQDVVTAGVGGALLAGLLTTAAMQGWQYNQVFKLLEKWEPSDYAA
ncbi:MAG: phytoene desaturase family protein [Oceanococcus sp.]